MTALTYFFTVRDSTQQGKRITALTPTWVFFKNQAGTNANLTQPTITEVGNGVYKFSYDPTGAEAFGQVDAGSALSLEGDRYIDGVCSSAAPISPASASTVATATAAAILATPANLLATDTSGFVTTNDPTAPIAAAILDTPLTGHNTSGTVGQSLTNIQSAPPALSDIINGVLAALSSAASTIWKQVF
jgi:hypothetical protein